MVNINSRRIINPTGHLSDIKKLTEKHALTDTPKKIEPRLNGTLEYSKPILYNDVDVNLHVNNSNYIDFIFDSYPKFFHKENSLRSIEISFKAELQFGDTVEIKILKDDSDNSVHYVTGIKANDKKVIFIAVLYWDKLMG
jgi:acyl-ACP thioesterase